MATYAELLELAKEVLEELTSRALTIAIAESCTGGLAASLLTDLDGASEVLEFSLVTYTQEAKEEFLGIPEYVFNNFGSISLECAKMMAEGVTEYEVDIGLATTGVIGEAIEDKLKGTAHIAVAIKGHQTIGKDLSLDANKSRYELKLEIVRELFEVLLYSIDTIF